MTDQNRGIDKAPFGAVYGSIMVMTFLMAVRQPIDEPGRQTSPGSERWRLWRSPRLTPKYSNACLLRAKTGVACRYRHRLTAQPNRSVGRQWASVGLRLVLGGHLRSGDGVFHCPNICNQRCSPNSEPELGGSSEATLQAHWWAQGLPAALGWQSAF